MDTLWGLSTTTTVCVTAFVVALGLLWMYVMLARPSSSAEDYERLEELLSDEGKKAAVKPSAGRKEQRRGRGKGRTVDATQSPRKKKATNSEGSSSGGEGGREREEGGREREEGGRGKVVEVVGKSPAVSTTKKLATVKGGKKGEGEREGEGEGEGEFQLVTTKASSKAKKDASLVATEGKDAVPVAKGSGKKKKEDSGVGKSTKRGSSPVSKATVTKGDTPVSKTATKEDAPVPKATTSKGDTPVVPKTTTGKGGAPVVPNTTTAKGDTPVSKTTETKEETPVISQTPKGKQQAPVISKATSDDIDGGDSKAVAVKRSKKNDPVPSGEKEGEGKGEKEREGKEEEGEWHTQLSRQQLRALKQKEKEKIESQKKTVVVTEEKTKDEVGKGGLHRSPRGRGGTGEGGGGVGRGGRREVGAGRGRRVREGEPKRWNLPNKGESAGTAGEGGVASLPDAPPTTVAPSGDSPVAHSDLTDLEKAMREAAFTSSSVSSDDITVTSSKPTTDVTMATTSSDDFITQDPDMENQSSQVVFPSATVTTATEQEGLSGGGMGREGKEAESPEEDEWVVLDPVLST